MMNDDPIYNVWARTGNRFDPVLNMKVSHATAKTIANLLTLETGVQGKDENGRDTEFRTTDMTRFYVSIGKPTSFGFAPEPVNLEPARERYSDDFRQPGKPRRR